jgi:hypothetical protein
MIDQMDNVGLSNPDSFWIPSSALVQKAEALLPSALAKAQAAPIRPNVPKFYSAKNGTSLNLRSAPDDIIPSPSDAFNEDFLHSLKPLSQYMRQYLGEVVKGKRVLRISFISYHDISIDPGLSGWNWRQKSVPGNYWSVLYDPTKAAFSDWEYTGWP